MNKKYDLVIIGGGPGGYIAAFRASNLKIKTLLIEKYEMFGGTCLHRGCIPTKALLHVADTISLLENTKKIGINIEKYKLNWEKVQKYKEDIINLNAGGIKSLLKKKGIDSIIGVGSILSKKKIKVIKTSGESIQIDTNNIIIATGGKIKKIKVYGEDKERILYSDTILNLKEIPKKLVIIGGGIIGLEFASIFSRLNTEVVILESMNSLLPNIDKSLSSELLKSLEKNNILFKFNINIKKIESSKSKVQINYLEKNKIIKIESDFVLVSIGREPNISKLNLQRAGIAYNEKGISVNKKKQTNIDNIYAIGDCTYTPNLAHVASAEGILAVDGICNNSLNYINYKKIPMCIYTAPQVAWCGLTEEEAEKEGYDINIGIFDIGRNAMASIVKKGGGLIKFVIDKKYGEILGVHIISYGATELLAEPSFAIQSESTIDTIINCIHAHPTLYESCYEAAAIVMNRGLHA